MDESMTGQPPASGGRYIFIDLLRGMTLLSMIAYHICWDIVELFGIQWAWFDGTGSYIWQQSICWSFILLSGFCWQLGRHALRRGLIVLIAGEIVSLVTRIADFAEPIYFGVLTLIGMGMLLLIPLNRLFRRIPPEIGLVINLALFFVLRDAKDGFLGFERWHFARIPSELYQNMLTAFFGFPPSYFYSSDYFPIVPWIFLYFAGYFIFTIWKRHTKVQPKQGSGNLLTALGQHTLPVYLLHQPVIFGVLFCIFACLAH